MMEEVLNKIQEKEAELKGLPEGHPERVPLLLELAALRQEVELLKLQKAGGMRYACMHGLACQRELLRSAAHRMVIVTA